MIVLVYGNSTVTRKYECDEHDPCPDKDKKKKTKKTKQIKLLL